MMTTARIRGFVSGACLTLILLSATAAFASEIRLFVASRAYVVTVAPVDEESRNAENSVLYEREGPGRPWREVGPCRREVLDNGDVRFHRNVTVEKDGIYRYTSRPVVGGEVTSPPVPESPDQAVVVVDTLPPVAEIIHPAEEAVAHPGQRVELSWTATDENLEDAPVALSYTTDGGKSWSLIERELPASGDTAWTAPADLDGIAIVRLTAVDKAGNVGRALRRMDAPPAIVQPDLPPLAQTSRPPADAAAPRPKQTPPPEPEPVKEARRDPNRAWLYYLMAINQMKQNKPADALQYYWLAVKEDPEFIDAWADIGLAYIDLGAYKTARDIVADTRAKAPDRIDLLHLMGETYHAEGMTLLGGARTTDERMKAKGMIDQAVDWYGRALEKAAEDWRLAEQAASYYRLGEICYYVNMDRSGARAYWRKILDLHSPTPNPDLVKWSAPFDREKARERLQRQTFQRVSLEAWQNWARGYLKQLDARERAGILDLMPAQQLSASDLTNPPAIGNNPMNPGRDDGRSLFSLPNQLGSPAPVAASVGHSQKGTAATPPGPGYLVRAAESYSFYAPRGGGEERAEDPSGVRASAGRDMFVYPQEAASAAGWNQMGAYGDKPDWR